MIKYLYIYLYLYTVYVNISYYSPYTVDFKQNAVYLTLFFFKALELSLL